MVNSNKIRLIHDAFFHEKRSDLVNFGNNTDTTGHKKDTDSPSFLEYVNALLGQPSVILSGSEIAQWREPAVYAWIRDNEILYIGKSSSGIARPCSSRHHTLRTEVIRPDDEIILWQCREASEDIFEQHLIDHFKPRYNGRLGADHFQEDAKSLSRQVRIWRDKVTSPNSEAAIKLLRRNLRKTRNLAIHLQKEVEELKAVLPKGIASKQSIVACSFCGKEQDQVNKLITGPSVYICNECVGVCNKIIEEETTAAD